MSRVLFISDLHIGHKNILNFSGPLRQGTTIEEHDNWLLGRINAHVTKRDILYILGDLAWTGEEGLERIGQLPGRKFLVRGNHDERFNAADLLGVFDDVFGLVKYKGAWLSHAPIHPDELRGKINIHGHVHNNSIRDGNSGVDPRYINVCVEALEGFPISYQDIINGTYASIRRC